MTTVSSNLFIKQATTTHFKNRLYLLLKKHQTQQEKAASKQLLNEKTKSKSVHPLERCEECTDKHTHRHREKDRETSTSNL